MPSVSIPQTTLDFLSAAGPGATAAGNGTGEGFSGLLAAQLERGIEAALPASAPPGLAAEPPTPLPLGSALSGRPLWETSAGTGLLTAASESADVASVPVGTDALAHMEALARSTKLDWGRKAAQASLAKQAAETARLFNPAGSGEPLDACAESTATSPLEGTAATVDSNADPHRRKLDSVPSDAAAAVWTNPPQPPVAPAPPPATSPTAPLTQAPAKAALQPADPTSGGSPVSATSDRHGAGLMQQGAGEPLPSLATRSPFSATSPAVEPSELQPERPAALPSAWVDTSAEQAPNRRESLPASAVRGEATEWALSPRPSADMAPPTPAPFSAPDIPNRGLQHSTNAPGPSVATLESTADVRRAASALDRESGAAALLHPTAAAISALTPSQATLTAAAPPAVQATLSANPWAPQFSSELGAQVSTWAADGIQHAQLHLNPVELGPVEIHIRMDGQDAHVQMSATHSETREALQLSMPELQQALQREGLQLGQADIRGGRGGDPSPEPTWRPRSTSAPSEAGDLLPPPALAQRRGLLDLYA